MSLPLDALDREWTLSASQLETFSTCQRKWAWEKIAGFKEGDTEATALGGRVHKILEDYLNHGILPDQSTREGQIATAGLHLIPAPRTAGMTVEFSFTFSSPRGNIFTGRKDYIVHDGIPVVGDHKTTSGWKWAKDEDELRQNIQAIIYAADELLRSHGEAVDLEWVYYLTRGAPAAKKVSLRILAPEVEKGFEPIDNLADELHAVRARTTKDNILDLPPTLDSCNKFNRPCPHTFRCNITPQGRLAAVMAEGSTMSNVPAPNPSSELFARLAAQAAAPQGGPPPAPPGMSPLDALRARQGVAAGPPPAPPPAYQPPPPIAPPPPPVQQVYQPPPPPDPGTWQGGPGGQWVQPPAPPPQYQAAPIPPGLPPQTIPMVEAPPPLIPPGTPTAPPPPATTWYLDNGINIYSCQCGLQVSDGVLAQHQGKCPRCGTQAQNFPSFLFQAPVNPPEQALPVPVTAAATPGMAAPPAPYVPGPPPPPAAPAQVQAPGTPQAGEKRKRRTKAEMEAARAAAAVPGAPPAPAPERPEGRSIGRLLIDTLPVGQACHTAEECVFGPARALVKQACQVDDYRQIDFGKGPGVFASAVQSILENGSWDTMYVDSRSADAMHTITLLAANSDETYRGMA